MVLGRHRGVTCGVRALVFCVCCTHLAIVAKASAQTVDTLVSPWPVQHRPLAEIISHAAVIAALAVDLMEGRDTPHEFPRIAAISATRAGVVFGGTYLLKRLIHRERPCARLGCGNDNPLWSFPSAHAAFAASTLRGKRLEFTIPLTITAGYMRVAAKKHWLTDVLAGAGIGYAASWIR